jgi:hypothetical protein
LGQSIECSGRGSGCRSGGTARASSEAETRLSARIALERGGVSVVRHCAPRVKRSFARGVLGLTA